MKLKLDPRLEKSTPLTSTSVLALVLCDVNRLAGVEPPESTLPPIQRKLTFCAAMRCVVAPNFTVTLIQMSSVVGVPLPRLSSVAPEPVCWKLQFSSTWRVWLPELSNVND